MQRNRKRSGTACTKERNAIIGGGKKPFRQKGTGRARQGTITAPNHVGGGTVFGIQVPGEVSFTDWSPPFYPVKFMMPAGAFMLLLQGIVWFIRDLYVAITGREFA